MSHEPIQFKNIRFSLPHKCCFEQLNETISYGQRIAIIGQNGCGKSTLLQLNDYPGAMLVISHDADFLLAIGATVNYGIKMSINKAGVNEFFCE